MSLKDLETRCRGEREGRWLVRHGRYVMDRRVFLAVLLVIVLWTTAGAVEAGFEKRIIVSCPPDRFVGCVNPYFDCVGGWQSLEDCWCTIEDPVICSKVLLNRGDVLGQPQGFFARSALFASLLFLLVGFFLNHMMHNRRFEWND